MTFFRDNLTPATVAAINRSLAPHGNVDPTQPTLEILQARAYDALHSYIVAGCAYDHAKATPTFNKLARHIEGELELANVGGERGAEPRSLPATVIPRGR